MPTLTELANLHGTDKGTITAQGHGYTLVYDALFSHLRERVTAICEVGLSRGGPEVSGGTADRNVTNVPSAAMWHDFFPKAQIVGVDISDCSAFENDWFKFVRADCGDLDQLARVADLGMQFDLIVDDGSHASYHQQLTFLTLFDLLKPGGLYVIEDLDWQPEAYETSLPAVPRTDILLDRFIRTGAFSQTGALAQSDWEQRAAQIESVLTFDSEWLAAHRRLTNTRRNAAPDYPTRVDRIDNGSRSLKQLGAALLRRTKAELGGPEQRGRYPEMKLALIRKAGAC